MATVATTSSTSARATPRERVHIWRAVGEAEVAGEVTSVVIRWLPAGVGVRAVGAGEGGPGALQVGVEGGEPPVGVLGGAAAAVRDVVEVAGGGAQPVGVGGQGAAGLGGGLVGGAAGAGVEEGAFLQGADDGPHAFLDGLVPVALGGVRLGGGAVFGGAAGAVVEQGGCGGRAAARVPRRHHRAATTASAATMTTTRPSAPPGVAVDAALNSSPTQSQKASSARWSQLGSFSWYICFDSSRRAASRAGSRGEGDGRFVVPAREQA